MEVREERRGFSYIELIIIMFIATTMLSGVMPLIYKSITANRAAKLKLIAYESASQEIEKMRGQAVSDMANHNFTVTGVPGATGTVAINKTVEGLVRTDIAAINSEVSWNFQGKNENVEINTFLYGNE